MKLFLVVLMAFALVGVARGGPTETAILAAMRLSENPNYRWSSAVTDDAASYYIEGKTTAEGWTWLRLPVTKAIARRLGREAGKEIEAFFLGGNESVVLRTEKGWQALAELPRRHPDWHDGGEIILVPVSGPFGAGSLGAGDPFMSAPFPTILMHAPPPAEKRRACSTAQFALVQPHADLAVIVSSYSELRCEGDMVTGVLTDVGAQLLLVRGGPEKIEPAVAAGAFKLHLKDGYVESYTVRLEALVEVDGKRHHVHQVSETTIKNIGDTRFEIPAEARHKLELSRAIIAHTP